MLFRSAVVAERVVDSAILHVIKLWLKAPVIGEDKDGTKKNVGGGKANSKGTLAVRRHLAVAVELLLTFVG